VTPDEVLRTYDARYAKAYDKKYITNPEMLPATIYQAALLKRQLGSVDSWLDVACGTGFYLSLFPDVPTRAGLDLSAPMLAHARRRSPDVRFFQGSFLASRKSWLARWQLVSCMWWAYCLVDGMRELERLVFNIASWVAEDGCAFIPLCNARTFRPRVTFPRADPDRPGVTLDGLVWSWAEDGGKLHRHMLSPLPETMRALFGVHFRDVEVVSAPRRIRRGYWSTDFLIARRKRRSALRAKT
jgi:SAM-dependent methyltransferase